VRVLVAVASKHHATEGIAAAIAATLRAEGMDVDVLPVQEVHSLEEFGAVVVGSGVYAGHWLKPAREFVERHEAALRQRAVWLFSSGPVGDPPKPEGDPLDVAPMTQRVHALGHRRFPGKLDRRELGMGERAMVSALRVPVGDFRDFGEVADWARGIAGWLRNHDVPPTREGSIRATMRT
jgi:menaquinone-dependent protoporphyrinogen oxidase